jgi:hypothetical protein
LNKKALKGAFLLTRISYTSLAQLNTYIMSKKTIIYESPDGGETIYVRESGSSVRQLYKVSSKITEMKQQLQEEELWRNIRLAAKTNAALEEILAQAKIIYHLSKLEFLCKTYFDITATGVTGHLKSSRIPFYDAAGQHITSEAAWNRARNQQRNWETLVQLLSMRTQLFQLTKPVKSHDSWSFEFEVETPAVFGPPDDPTQLLLADASGIPMLLNLDNKYDLAPMLAVSGEDQNIWFTSFT